MGVTDTFISFGWHSRPQTAVIIGKPKALKPTFNGLKDLSSHPSTRSLQVPAARAPLRAPPRSHANKPIVLALHRHLHFSAQTVNVERVISTQRIRNAVDRATLLKSTHYVKGLVDLPLYRRSPNLLQLQLGWGRLTSVNVSPTESVPARTTRKKKPPRVFVMQKWRTFSLLSAFAAQSRDTPDFQERNTCRVGKTRDQEGKLRTVASPPCTSFQRSHGRRGELTCSRGPPFPASTRGNKI
eukprot:SAG11_NODE_889_length_6692_cov_6.292280_3_plen_241_part_00